MSIKGLIFDLDGTVTLTQQFHAQAFIEVFKNHGQHFTAEDDARFSGRGAHCTFPEFFAEKGITISKEQTEALSQEKNEVYKKIIRQSEIKPVPGVEKFLEAKQSEGFKIIMATGNKLDSTEYLLGQVGLRKYFADIVTNEHITKSKPAPDIFLKAAEKLGLKPEECIVFEDAVNGVTGAKAAKMKCIALKTTTPEGKLREAGADYLINSYNEVSPEMLT